MWYPPFRARQYQSLEKWSKWRRPSNWIKSWAPGKFRKLQRLNKPLVLRLEMFWGLRKRIVYKYWWLQSARCLQKGSQREKRLHSLWSALWRHQKFPTVLLLYCGADYDPSPDLPISYSTSTSQRHQHNHRPFCRQPLDHFQTFYPQVHWKDSWQKGSFEENEYFWSALWNNLRMPWY